MVRDHSVGFIVRSMWDNYGPGFPARSRVLPNKSSEFVTGPPAGSDNGAAVHRLDRTANGYAGVGTDGHECPGGHTSRGTDRSGCSPTPCTITVIAAAGSPLEVIGPGSLDRVIPQPYDWVRDDCTGRLFAADPVTHEELPTTQLGL